MQLKETLLDILMKKDSLKLKQVFEDTYTIDIALAMSECDSEELALFVELVDSEDLASVIEESEDDLQKKFLSMIDSKRLVEILTYMSSDDIADILGIINIVQRKEILKTMKVHDSSEIQVLLGYGPDTAGGIMTTQYISLLNTLTTMEALNKIKRIGPKTEVIEIIFVVNHLNELVGYADLRDILVSPEETKLQDIMNENVIFVHPETDQEEASLIVSKYDLKALPVINHKHIILGIITLDDVIDVIVREHTEDLLMLSGVSKDEKVGSNFSASVHNRLPWLFVNLITAFMAAFTVGLFEDVIVQVVALAAVMPIVAGMGGNAGSQTLSVMIRSIALGEVDFKEDWKLVFKEVALGLFNGLAIGFVTGFILYIKYNNLFLGVIILIAMVGNLMIAGFFGFLIPMILKKLRIDPAISSSIFLTTATDVCGFFLFLGLAKLFLPYLI